MRCVFVLALALPLLGIACATPMVERGEDEGETGSAINGDYEKGDRFITIARLNLRKEAAEDAAIQKTLALNVTIEIIGSAPTKGFYRVQVEDTKVKGFIHAMYLSTGAKKLKATANEEDTDKSAEDEAP